MEDISLHRHILKNWGDSAFQRVHCNYQFLTENCALRRWAYLRSGSFLRDGPVKPVYELRIRPAWREKCTNLFSELSLAKLNWLYKIMAVGFVSVIA